MEQLLIEKISTAIPYGKDFLVQNGIRGINCGSGTSLKSDCLNVDQSPLVDAKGTSSEPGKIVRVQAGQLTGYYMQYDMTQAFPFPSGSFSWGYSEHFIEHVPLKKAIAWLAEMRRLIAPGGLLRITTPDLQKYLEGYVDPEERFFRLHGRRLAEMTNNNSLPTRRAWMVNQIFHYYGHQWIYDFDEIVHAASAAGFDPASVVRREFQSGMLEEVFLMDAAMRNDETMYVEMLA